LWPVRVYWEDTDAGGIVYYANYLKFMERARTEWLRSLGVDQGRLAAEQGLIFTIVSVSVEYKRPARLDDELVVTCAAHTQGKASFAFTQEIHRARFGGELISTGQTRAACLELKTLRPRPLPAELLQAIAAQGHAAPQNLSRRARSQ
jgi:acyl-CoA thioester hydrolase